MIVFGGGIDKSRTQTSTTEIHVLGYTRWDTVTPLPRLYWDIAGITVNNAVYGIGKLSFNLLFIYINLLINNSKEDLVKVSTGIRTQF